MELGVHFRWNGTWKTIVSRKFYGETGENIEIQMINGSKNILIPLFRLNASFVRCQHQTKGICVLLVKDSAHVCSIRSTNPRMRWEFFQNWTIYSSMQPQMPNIWQKRCYSLIQWNDSLPTKRWITNTWRSTFAVNRYFSFTISIEFRFPSFADFETQFLNWNWQLMFCHHFVTIFSSRCLNIGQNYTK